MLMEVDSDSGPEIWDKSQKKVVSSSDSDCIPLAKVKKKAVFMKRQKKRRRSDASSEGSESNQPNHDRKNTEVSKKEKRYECQICGKRLISKTHLRQHSFTHFTSDRAVDPKNQFNSTAKNKKNSSNKWICDDCGRTFSSENTLNRHRNSFPSPHFFPCEPCGAVFLKSETYNKHVAIKHPVRRSDSVDTCTQCRLQFVSQEQLAAHTLEVHGIQENRGTIYSCSICQKEFVSEEGLIYHEANQHKDGEEKVKTKKNCSADFTNRPASLSLTCKICSAVLNTRIALQSHLKTHNVKKNMELRTGTYQCIVCPRSFSSSDGLKYHLATHTGERRYGCSICNRRFIKKTHLSEHIATHSETKCFTCERCPRTFSTHSAFKKHMKMFPGPHNFFCGKCGKVFMKESMLEKHLCVDVAAVALAPEVIALLPEDLIEEYTCLAEEADRESGLSCYKCFKMFPTEEALWQHQRDHLGKNTYQCRFCAETFNRSSAFTAHIVDHFGTTPYRCRQCNRKFISPFTLANHLKNFPGEHSFTCSRCKRWFPCPKRLESHDCILQNAEQFQCACNKSFNDWNRFLEHFGKKPFKCCACSQEFVTLMQLTRHIKRHTGARPFICSTCGKTFLTKANHLAHLKIHESATLQCKLCSYHTKFQKRFDIHVKKRHDLGTSSSTLCPVCGLLLSDMAAMKKHLEVDHENTIKIEEDCSEEKTTSGELCTLCGKMLTNKYSLRSHIKTIHSTNKMKIVKMFSCDVCGETFRRATHLDKHSEEHDEPGPRPCPECQVSCNSLKDLRKHMRKHDTNKPFRCEMCDKRFKVAVSLKYHATICGRESKRRHIEQPAPVSIFNDYEPIFIPVNARISQW